MRQLLLGLFICAVVLGQSCPESNKRALSAGSVIQTLEAGRHYFSQKDWTAPLESLQAVLDEPELFLKEKNEKGIEISRNLRAEVESLIAELPEEGLKFYRLKFEGQARDLLKVALGDEKKGIAADLKLLEEIYWRFGNTEAGLAAGSQLAQIHRLIGHPYTASFYLESLLKRKGIPVQMRQTLLLNQAAAYAMQGEGTQSAAAFALLEKEPKKLIYPEYSFDRLKAELNKLQKPESELPINRYGLNALVETDGHFGKSEAYLKYRNAQLEKLETKLERYFEGVTAEERWEVADPRTPGTTFDEKLRYWLGAAEVNREKKINLLVTLQPGPRYQELLKILPNDQVSQVVVMVSARRQSNIAVFEKLALAQKEKNGPSPDMKLANFESFKFVAFKFPLEGKKVTLGSVKGDKRGFEDVKNQREVTFKKPFQMQMTPVTQLQWALVMGWNPARFKEDLNRPIETVSWDDVQGYIKRLNGLDPKYHYRLPTEAEWEYAARGGTETAYFFGNDPAQLGEYAWYSENSGGKTHPVATKKANPYGLYDVHGSVWQWTADWYQEDTSKLSGDDPMGPKYGVVRVVRGGGWNHRPSDLVSTSRHAHYPDYWDNNLGFRLVRTEK